MRHINSFVKNNKQVFNSSCFYLAIDGSLHKQNQLGIIAPQNEQALKTKRKLCFFSYQMKMSLCMERLLDPFGLEIVSYKKVFKMYILCK